MMWKEEQIRWMNSIWQWVNLLQGQLTKENEEEIKTRVYGLANFFYGIEPERTDIESKIESAKTVEDLNALKEQIVKSDSVLLFNKFNDRKIQLWV